MNATITNKYLAVAALFAAEKDVRYYLNGVHVAPAPQGKDGVILTATNGHVLVTMHDAAGTCDVDAIYPLPRDLVMFCRKQKHLDGSTTFGDGKATAANGAGASVVVDASPIDGKYPDVSRAIPRDLASGKTCAPCFAAQYAALPAAVAGLLCAKVEYRGVKILAVNPDGPAAFCIEGAPEFFGVIMPLRSDIDAAVPWWLE